MRPFEDNLACLFGDNERIISLFIYLLLMVKD